MAETGVAAAALLSAGLACTVFGLLVILTEASPVVAAALNVPASVGPLSGKAIATIAVWACAWSALHYRLHRREVDLGPVVRRALVMTGIGFLTTFPPIFQLFSHRP